MNFVVSPSESLQQPVDCPLCGGRRRQRSWLLNEFATDRCRECGFIYVNPRPTDESIDKIYQERDADGVIGFYERMATPNVLASYERKLQWIEERLPGQGRLLDFGCAAAFVVEAASKRGWEAHGVDLGDWVLKAAAKRGVKNIHIGHLADLNFPEDHFDVIYAAQVLEHIASPSSAVAELRRILRPNGLLYVDVPNNRTLPILLGLDDFELNLPPQHLNYFTPATLRLLLEKGGFQVETVGSEGGIKWENVIGQRIRSDIADAARTHATSQTLGTIAPGVASRPGLLKQFAMMIAKTPVYAWAKLGINLFALGRRPKEIG